MIKLCVWKEPFMDRNRVSNGDEIDIKDIFKIIKNYKWLIFGVTLLFITFSFIYLYFKTPTYSSYTIIKIKTKDKNKYSKDDILEPETDSDVTSIEENIALIKTFYINEKVLGLNRVDYRVQYYKKEGLKRVEISDLLPIRVEDIEIFDRKFLGKILTIIPREDGFSIKMRDSLLDKLFGRGLDGIDENEVFAYNQPIKSRFFKFKIEKLSNYTTPIEIKINYDYRYIYESIIKDSLSVAQLEDDISLIKISYSDNIQSRGLEYLESLLYVLIDENLKSKNEKNNRVLNFISEEIDRIKKRLNSSEKRLERYSIENEAVEPSVQASTYIKKLTDIDIQLSENMLKRQIVDNIESILKREYNLDAISPLLLALKDTSTLKLIELLQQAQLERDELLSEFTYKYPKVKAVQKRIESLKAKIATNIKNLKREIIQTNRSLNRLKNSYEKKIKKLPTKERKLVSIKRDYEVSSKLYNFLLQKKAENEMIRVAIASDYKVIDRPYSSPVPINTKLILIISAILGAIVGVIVAFLYDIIRDRVLDIKDIEKRVDTPIYPIFTSIENIRDDMRVCEDLSQIPLESYRNLRTLLKLSLKDKHKMILVSSTIRGEGAEEVAVNLAKVFAMANYKSLLIDLDIRRGSLGEVLNIKEPRVGLIDYLIDDSTRLDDIIYHHKEYNLDIILAGRKRVKNPSELILSDALANLIEMLKRSYDYVIVNSTPFGFIQDTKYIMQFSDINLIVFRAKYSKKSDVLNLNRFIKKERLNNTWIIFKEEQY